MSAINTNATPETRRRVRNVLIEPLVEMGLIRGCKRTVADLDGMLERLCGRLAYLDDKELVILREVVLEIATGQLRDVWPAEATIYNQATHIRRAPPSFSEKVRSVMKSAMGRTGVNGGYGGLLLDWLRAHPGVPHDYVIAKLKEQSGDIARVRERMRRDLANGRRVDEGDGVMIERADKLDALARSLAFPELAEV